MNVLMETPIIVRSDKSKVEYLGRYKVQKQLGQGTFGTVFKCTTYKGQEYAIKQIHNIKMKKMMKNELDALRSVCSKFVVRYYELFYDKQDLPCIVFELCEGGTLQDYARKFPNQCIPEKLALNIFVKILLGFKVIHEANLIHRDVKLQNILMRGDDPKIGDFGLATQQKQEESEKSEGLAGTPAYMAPEVLERSVYDKQVDVWGLGVLLFAMLFGDHPFLENTAFAQLQKIQSLCTPKLRFEKLRKPKFPAVDDQTIELMEKMLVLDPKQRVTIQELLNSEYIKANDISGELMPKALQMTEEQREMNKKRSLLKSLNSSIQPDNEQDSSEDNEDGSPQNDELKILNQSKSDGVIETYLFPYKQLMNRVTILQSTIEQFSDADPQVKAEFSSGELQCILYFLSRVSLYYLQGLNKVLDERENIFSLEGWSDFIFSRSYVNFQAQVSNELQIQHDKTILLFQSLKILMQPDAPLEDRVRLLQDIEENVLHPQESLIPQNFSFKDSKLTQELKIASRAVFYSAYSRLSPKEQEFQSPKVTRNSLNVPGSSQASLSILGSSTNWSGTSPATQKGNKTPSSQTSIPSFTEKGTSSSNRPHTSTNIPISSPLNQKSPVNLQQKQVQTKDVKTPTQTKSFGKQAKSVGGSAAEQRSILAKAKSGFSLLLCCILNHIILINDPTIQLQEFQKQLAIITKGKEVKNNEIFQIFRQWVADIDLKTIESQSVDILKNFLPQMSQQSSLTFF